MWKAQRWTPVRFAFFFNRYWSLLSVVLTMCFAWLEFAPKTCDRVQVLVPVAGIFVFLGCEFLFGARVWVMWNRRTWIAYFFGILALAGATVQVWAVTHNMALRLPPGLRGCLSVRADQNNQWAFWLPLLLYDTTATIFMLKPVLAHCGTTPPSRLLSIFLRDGVLYFIIVFACNLINLIYFCIPSVLIPGLNSSLAILFTTMMASRIVLHLRSVANSPGGSNASATHGQSNTSPKFRNLFKSDVAELPDAPLRSGVRRIDGGMEAAYADVIVTVEADTNMEKRLEAAADAEDEEMEHSVSKTVLQ
ncbi:hypothetical protein BT69DRAFT_237652 [Atractiella rhizophila]|nr:hypothetical protein BT69DRAFT_237652 [Atractiella rhizophila]